MVTGGVDQAVPVAVVQAACRLPKRGGQISECEDRFGFVSESSSFRAAVSDGASASLLSGEWAEMLVAAFLANLGDDPAELAQRISDQAEAWNAMVDAIELPWYARAKRSEATFAALLGISVRRDGQWLATALGDCCVFQVRRDLNASPFGCIASFPFSRIGQFGSTPDLIGTAGSPGSERFVQTFGKWQLGDDLYLMTDALAEWFVGELQRKREPWRWFDALESSGNALSFERFIDDLRASGKLKDDDVTLLHVKISGFELDADN